MVLAQPDIETGLLALCFSKTRSKKRVKLRIGSIARTNDWYWHWCFNKHGSEFPATATATGSFPCAWNGSRLVRGSVGAVAVNHRGSCALLHQRDGQSPGGSMFRSSADRGLRSFFSPAGNWAAAPITNYCMSWVPLMVETHWNNIATWAVVELANWKSCYHIPMFDGCYAWVIQYRLGMDRKFPFETRWDVIALYIPTGSMMFRVAVALFSSQRRGAQIRRADFGESTVDSHWVSPGDMHPVTMCIVIQWYTTCNNELYHVKSSFNIPEQ